MLSEVRRSMSPHFSSVTRREYVKVFSVWYSVMKVVEKLNSFPPKKCLWTPWKPLLPNTIVHINWVDCIHKGRHDCELCWKTWRVMSVPSWSNLFAELTKIISWTLDNTQWSPDTSLWVPNIFHDGSKPVPERNGSMQWFNQHLSFTCERRES